MTPEVLFHELLGLGENWKVEKIEFLKDSKGEVHIVVESQPELFENLRCEECSAVMSLYDHAPERTWRHLNIFEHVCYLHCKLPRCKCNKCGKMRRIEGPWQGKTKGFTLMFEAMCLTLLREMPVNAVARITGEHDTRLWRLLNSYVERSYEQKDFSEVEVIGCDELSAKKGPEYVSVFADMKAKEVIFATPGKSSDVFNEFSEELSKHGANAKQIREISVDMSPAYTKGIRDNFSNTQIVYDRFHVFANISKAVDEVRQREHRKLIKQGDKTLKNTMWLFRKNPENLSADQSVLLDDLTQTNLMTAKAHQMRLTLQDIYNYAPAVLFKRKILAWCKWIDLCVREYGYIFEPMKKAAKTLRKYLDGIVAYKNNRTNNAFMEGLNSVFSAVKRKARGFRNTQNLITMLYFVSGNLPLDDLELTHRK